MLHSRTLLFIHFSLPLLIPNSQSIPPALPSPLATSSLFSMSVSLFLFCRSSFVSYSRFHCDSDGKESACNAGDLGLIPELGRSPGEGKGYPLQYSGLETSMDCKAHGVTKSQTQLRDLHTHTRFHI